MDMSNMSGMDMGSPVSSVASITSAVSSVVSAAVTSATTTTSMSMDHSTMSMGGMDHSTMDMSSMHMGGMNMKFSTNWNNYEVLFTNLKATSGGAAFGIFVFLFAVAFTLRGIIFFSSYLEQNIWRSSSAVVVAETQTVPSVDCGCDDDEEKISSSPPPTIQKPSLLRQFFFTTFTEFKRDVIRLVIAFVAIMLSYALMLAVMTYVVLYFFAVVLGLAFGELWWGRIGRIMNVSPANGVCVAH
ncbi:hypothetical protein BABINDRAFT_161504 [Babjeviella inositovora NRRL Y-12698]|uniref:Copper transport protein n=1 Tax=Babjeviella inositovora NRRL Y-12698 TaxID=984486 RepID=A0A1E3QQN5_9ASCO|nr:uncharacterized protein BABINDRAFT_161504 [Babjeviella inositovora NRRL Y-12698]ODQ79814.1 hypothetical protein BABINDRAFT_161504 [Babjeviella inositovora NRRL Y-12698]